MGKREEIIPIPDDVEVEIIEGDVRISGPKGETERVLFYPGISIEKVNSTIKICSILERKKQIAIAGTFASHIKNMVEGVKNGFVYKLKIVYSHFPIQVNVKDDGVTIGNFLGERKQRRAKIVGDTKVDVDGDEIIISGIVKEDVGQTAANIELATKIKRKDPRVFQDGIYIVEKADKRV